MKADLALRDDRQVPERDHIVAQVLSEEMIAIFQPGRRTKRTAVRLAIINTIRSDVLKPGDFLPSEKELTRIMGVSLGTVQAALSQLQNMGTIVRRRGDGTRVAAHEPLVDTVWHFRFLSRGDRKPLRIKDEELRLETTSETGVWSDHLGRHDLYLRIWRRLTMRDGNIAGAEMYLSYSMGSALTEIDIAELRMANIRPYLEETLGLVTRSATHLVETVRLDGATASEFGLRPSGEYYEIHAKAHAPDRRPVYFQRIYVSTSDCVLEF